MTPEQIDRVFGRGRLKMATGEHVEVFREAVTPGERRRYTKRFLNTREGDYGQWTEREWRILARLIGHGIACVPDVVQFDRGRLDGMQLVQTYDAGVTVDQWATLLPVRRDGRVYRHVFEDCAHWWALAHHCLLALDVIHPLELVHLDVKGDNVCIPYAPASFDPESSDLRLQPVFAQLALIDFAFALISRERLTTPLPIGWEKEYDYQSPRLLAALEAGHSGELQLTRELDWRCDMYSLAAMLKRYLPEESLGLQPSLAAGWTGERYDAAKGLILRLRDCHDRELPTERPHAALIELCGGKLREPELASSLEREWTLAREASVSPASASPLTPVTRLAPATRPATSIPVTRSGRITAVTVVGSRSASPAASAQRPAGRPEVRRARGIPLASAGLVAMSAFAAALWYASDRARPLANELQALAEPIRAAASKTAGQAADAMRRLAGGNPEAGPAGTVAGHAPAPPAATVEESTATSPPPAAAALHQPAVPQSTPGTDTARSGPLAASSAAQQLDPAALTSPGPGPAGAPTLPSSPAVREATAAPPAPRRSTRAQATAASTNVWLPAPVRPPSAAARTADKTPRTPSARAPAASHIAQSHASSQARRLHASWASLQPPAWLHGPGPGEPAGAKTHEPNTALAPTSTDAAAAQAPASPAAARVSAPASAEPARPAATPAAADSPRSTPLAPLPAAQSARAPLPAAPLEHRSEAVALAAAAPDKPDPGSVAADRATQDEFAAQARRMLLDTVPRLARQAEPEVARVLWLAANAYHPLQERAVADAALLTRIPEDASLLAQSTAPGEARHLNDQARVLASRRYVVEAFNVQLRAFGANPRDPEIAGNLAQLYLRLTPPRPDMARQVVLVAMAARAPQFRLARLEDWRTFAVASALSGREADATNALFVTLALFGDAERGCAAALNALADYGERLRRPVEAMFYRVQAQGRGYGSPACAWPPNWSALSRLP